MTRWYPLLDEEFIKKTVDAVNKVIAIRQVAWMVGVTPNTIHDYLNIGRKDVEEGRYDTIHVKFLFEVQKTRAEKVHAMLAKIESGKQNWQANGWILERCFREDFGADAGKLQELGEEVDKLKVAIEGFVNSQKQSNQLKDV